MPKFFTFLGFWIGRFSDEEKRPHVHVLKFGSEESMKVWLEPGSTPRLPTKSFLK